MKVRHSKLLVISTILFVTCGCGAKEAVLQEQRYLQTGMHEEDAIVILLNQFLEEDKPKESESNESYIEKCMSQAMVSENPHLSIITAKKFRESLFPGKSFIEAPRSPEALLPYLSNDTVKSQLVQFGVHYIVIINVDTFNSEKGLYLDGSNAGFGIGQSWTRYSRMDAHILDVRLLGESGWVHASSEGECRAGIGVLLVIPFPIAGCPGTENKACSALGKATIKFIEGRGPSKP